MFANYKFLNLLSLFICLNIYIAGAQVASQTPRAQKSSVPSAGLPDALNGSDLSQFALIRDPC